MAAIMAVDRMPRQGTLVCRECRAQGSMIPLEGVAVKGQPLLAVPAIPRCACFLRSSQGKVPATASNMFASLPSLPTLLGAAAPALSTAASSEAPSRSSAADANAAEVLAQRATHSFNKLPSREIMVYLSEYCEEALLGSVIVTPEHKLSDVLDMLRDELDVQPSEMFRGAEGESLRVPLHKRQYRRQALPFFPSARDHLVVEQADHE